MTYDLFDINSPQFGLGSPFWPIVAVSPPLGRLVYHLGTLDGDDE